MIVDGRAIAEDIYAELEAACGKVLRQARLGIVVCGDDPVIHSFVRIKERSASRLGVEVVREDVPRSATTDDLIAATKRVAGAAEAVIVQLPLPPHVDTEAALRAIPKEKDADAINPALSEEERLVHAPVALAILEILRRSNVEIRGKRTVVVGKGRLVGTPAALLLRRHGTHVKVVTRSEGSLDDISDADIVVLGAGNPGFVTPQMIKKDAAIIDAGTSESGGKVVGDADPACAEKAALFTPVPGGVGPVAVAMIFKNLCALAEAAK
ncbi:hypothetical protein COU20_00995 [Candidatus Kaiserbacteria bacterium CG10_big_fil_rev_8_21_14_0_10_59_10]|uniref:Methenyltetrahydrofolate cyclohydrolase n=1 Tax=Candidatus Kaiserbacteria bacterium CG10_big_fil_rev_8_21_14_0_10_59_10 TaxID=1974612 RepID=A0A2H0U8K4_9BACT|nr:MAG: hypothetical protein COU20_00995 [Candidatus Kaiserbacteria bacterium CG10_big_fil_rev_8_21_14_0_10_59_10]